VKKPVTTQPDDNRLGKMLSKLILDSEMETT
jgi:hypothetical protein